MSICGQQWDFFEHVQRQQRGSIFVHTTL